MPPHPTTRYVCVQNRNRDNYEVPLALAEAGLLDAFVTDFYASPRWQRFLPGFLARRHRDELPAELSRMGLDTFALQYAGELLRLPMHKVFGVTDRLLGAFAARTARRNGSGLLAYSSYLARDPGLAPHQPVIDFEYHPHPALSMKILEEDFQLYPQVSWSFEREQKSTQLEIGSEAWQHSDLVLCASSMTRWSLEFAGCPPERIKVIPYGMSEALVAVEKRPPGICRFLFVGQGIQRKGLHHLALAWRKARLPQAELTIVAYRLDPGIAALLDQPGITVCGRLEREALDREFARADVFVMPSLVEGFGLVYLEALRAGCHVVGTQNTGLPDLDLSADAATILRCGDIDGLAATLADLAATKARGTLDPAVIASELTKWTWSDFRQAVSKQAVQLAQERQAGELQKPAQPTG